MRTIGRIINSRSGVVVLCLAVALGAARGHGIGERMVARWPNLLAPTYGVLLQRMQ